MWYKTKPHAQQLAALKKAAGRPAFAYLCEMGTGKSKMVIDEASILFSKGAIGAVLILCPNGGQQNWVLREIPAHCAVKYKAAYKVAGWKKAERNAWLDTIAAPPDTLKFFCINIDQLVVKAGVETMESILKLWPTYMAVDESHRVKGPDSQRSLALHKLGPRASHRRILSGTASPQSPLDLFSQFYFLDSRILGHSSFTPFRAEYAVLQKMPLADKYQPRGSDGNTTSKRFYWKILAYRNGEKLKALIAPYSFSCKLTDCVDMPPLIFRELRVELTDSQRRIYDDLKQLSAASIEGCPAHLTSDDAKLLWLIENADIVPGHALTELLRLQQVVGGFVDGHVLENNRIATLLDHLEDISGPVIIWARFVADIEAIADALGDDCVTYYGKTKPDERTRAVDLFQSGQRRYFVGQPSTAGIMLTLTASSHIVHYSKSWKADDYLQSNARAWRIGQRLPVTVTDMIAADTIDRVIHSVVKQKAARMDELLYGV